MSEVPERRYYSEQEVTRIIGRAAEIAEADGSQSFSPGVTVEELQRIAKEVGISVHALEQSVSEHNNFTEIGDSSQAVETFERIVEGEIDATNLEALRIALKAFRIPSGTYTQIDRSIGVTLSTGISQAKVTLNSRGGRTKIVVKSDSTYAFLMTVIPAFVATAIATAVIMSMGSALGAVVAATVIIGTCWWAFKRLSLAGHKRALRATDWLRASLARALEMNHSQPSTIPTTVQEDEEHLNQGT